MGSFYLTCIAAGVLFAVILLALLVVLRRRHKRGITKSVALSYEFFLRLKQVVEEKYPKRFSWRIVFAPNVFWHMAGEVKPDEGVLSEDCLIELDEIGTGKALLSLTFDCYLRPPECGVITLPELLADSHCLGRQPTVGLKIATDEKRIISIFLDYLQQHLALSVIRAREPKVF